MRKCLQLEVAIIGLGLITLMWAALQQVWFSQIVLHLSPTYLSLLETRLLRNTLSLFLQQAELGVISQTTELSTMMLQALLGQV